MADGDGLENRCSCKGTVGSNPTPSAILKLKYNNKHLLGISENRSFFIFANVLLTSRFRFNGLNIILISPVYRFVI